jgi:hypothetical protein
MLFSSIKIKQSQFDALIIYYWLIQLVSYNWITRDAAPTYVYFAIIIPILIFIGINISSVAHVIRDSSTMYYPLLIYIVLVAVVSVVRQDYATAYNVAIFSLAILIILRNQLVLKLRLLNILYLLTLAFCIYSYHQGINLYGYLPNQGVGEYYEKGRSLFPYAIVGSAFFSLIVFMKNYIYNKSKFRWPYIFISGYFVFFSYNRTSIICLIIFMGIVTTVRFSEFRDRPLYRMLPALVLLLFVLFVFNSDSFSSLLSSSVNSESLEYLSSNRDLGTVQELSGSARPFLMSSQVSVFLQSPLFGVGTFTLDNAFGLSGSETFLTGLLARIGLLIVPFVVFYVMQFKAAIIEGALMPYATLIILVIIMMTYGVIMVPYELMFLLLIGLLNDRDRPSLLRQKVNTLQKTPFGSRRLLRPS